MEENKLKGLRKLQGLQGISKEEQEIWRTINREKLKGKDSRYEDRLYRNQQFVKTFGKEALLSYNKNQRDAIYKDYVANEIFKETYSPYTGKVDKLGNPIVDPNKGMGNAEEYEKYNSMTADGKIKLLESGWKSENQLNNLLKKRQESHRKALSNTNAFIGAPAYAQGAALYSKEVTDPIDEVYSKGKNNAIIDKIYSDDLKKQTKLLDKEVAVEYDTNIRNLSDDEVNKEFMQRITPSENSLGNNNFKAFFHDGNNIESEVKDYSIDDKRLYLAKANVYNKYFGAYTAKDALEYEAQEYINDHQDIIDYSGALANDIGIATMSYTASKVNGIRQGINRFRGNSLVWIDSDGNIIAPNKIKTASNGAHYYTNNEGYNTIVKQREMSIANLDLLGKDADGYDLPNIFNNQYWSDAEQFGTLNKEEQQEYKKLGVSPHKVMYKPGEGTDYKYETAKMLSFGMADALINLLPYGLGWAGKTLQGANTFLNATGKVMQWSGKMSGAIQPTASAIGLGHQYGIGTFNEGFAQNMANLEEKVYNNIETEFKEKYQNNAKFKASIDKQVQAEYNKLKKEQQRQLSAGENNMQIADQKVNDELLKRQAMNNVGTAYKQEELKKARNSDKYFNSVSKAIEDAGVSATAMAVTDAAKYSIVNNFGYRKYLFGTAESRKVSALKKMSDKVSEKDGILKFNGLLNLKENAKKLKTALSDAEKRAVLAEKAKTIGKIVKDQAIGGAWTNYTDEMQSWGSKQINEDMFTSYLNNTYDVESAVDLYNALDGVESFLKGATGSIGRKSNTDAGIVGITGSLFTLAPNVAGILHAFTKEGKKQWSKATNGERINMIVQQGILNNYYAKKQAEAEIQRSVDMVNTLNQQNDNFTSLRQVLTLNRAIENATNQEQKNILTYLQALTSIQNLHKFSTDVGVQEQSSSRIKEWFRKKFGGDESALDAVAAQSTILTKALAELSEITSGNFNDATKKELLAEYYAKNPDKAQTEENNNKALEEITNNAKSLIEAESKWQEIDAKLKQVEEDRGEPINSKAREKLLTNSALDSYYGERINTLEEKISGKAANTSREFIGEIYGKAKAVKRQITTLERDKKETERRIQSAKDAYEKTEALLKKYEETHDFEHLSDFEKTEYRELVQKAEAERLQLEYLQQLSEQQSSKIEQLTEYTKETNSRVLTKEEILMLPSEARAFMLDESNLNRYSKEQQKVLKELTKELNLKDPSILQSIQDQAYLARLKEANASAYNMILSNPEAAAVQLQVQQEINSSQVNNYISRLIGEQLDRAVRRLARESNMSKEDIGNVLYSKLREYNPYILDYLYNTRTDEKGLGTIATYKEIMQKAKDWSEMVANIRNAIDKMELDDTTTKLFSKNIEHLIDEAGSTEEAMQILNDISESMDVSTEDRANFKKLLSMIDGIEKQKASTVKETKESKEARQESQETQVKQEEKKVQDAENKVDIEKSNEKNAQEAIEVTDKEAANDKYAEEHKEEIITNGEEVPLRLEEEAPTESPNLDKQVANTKSEKPITVREVTTDVTNQGNTLQSSSSDMLGNTMYGYDNKALEEDGKEVVRAGSDPKDAMSRYFNWLHNEGIKLQEIIDNELHSISKVNKKIELLYVNPLQNATDDAALGNFTLLCVEYTDEVAKIHKEERGGVVTAGGKKYLIVGTLGFAKNNTAQGDAFRSITRQGHQQRDSYFRDNPTERFFVDKSMSTEIEQMTSGRIVREKIGDSETKVRPITEILNDSSRNPKGLKLVDLKWGIQYGRKFATVGVSERNTVYPPRDSISNSGAVFVLIEAANGNYIPAAIKPTLLGDIQEGTFKTILNNLFNELTSVNYNDRKKAISQLVQLLVLNKNGNNILIGKEGINTVSIVREGNILKTFNVADSNFDRMELIRAIEDLNPRINITLSTLSDPVLLQAFADAGALNTDIAKLGTSNAGFTVSAIDAEGKPIKTVTIENKEPNLEGNSDLAKANYKQQHSIYYKGTLYREKNNKWYTDNWKEVTDIDTIQQLKLSNYIRTNNLSPVLVNSSKQKGKVVEVYVINDSKVITKEDGVLIERNEEDSKKITTYLRNKQLQKDREQKAQEELKTKQPEASENTTPKVLTDEQLIAQGNGDFTSTAKPQSTDSEVRAQEVVDRIITDTHDIVLDEKRSIYTDSTGKEYARVTSVIQATEGAKRFYPNSPWILPSTKIGTGIDEFVRDFFAGKLGNLENLHKRYPNASLPQLQAFEKQLKELKADFDKKGLTVVPRDVTVTGEVEVTDANGKKYKLSVAGTLDLLAYDKDGNFYIFDMKTNRSIPNDNKASKWSKQLSLYKQFLEEKYGINVKGTEIIPIKVSYPSPYAVSYKAEGNQLSTTVDGLEESFRSSKPILYPNIPISTSPVKVEYNLLTNEERSMLSPIIDGTYNPTTGTINKESVNKSNEDINKTGNKSLAELQASANTNPTDINSILKNRTYSRRVREVLKKKGFKGKPSEVTEWLKEHNMPSTNIQDIDAWLDMLENCR